MIDYMEEHGRNARWAFGNVYEVYPRSVVLSIPEVYDGCLAWMPHTSHRPRRIILLRVGNSRTFKIASMTTPRMHHEHIKWLNDKREEHNAAIRSGDAIARTDRTLYLYDESNAGQRYIIEYNQQTTGMPSVAVAMPSDGPR